MGALDQPLLIANSNYHVGHQIAIFVAEDYVWAKRWGSGAGSFVVWNPE